MFFEVVCAVVLCVCACIAFLRSGLCYCLLYVHWRRRLYTICVYVIASAAHRLATWELGLCGHLLRRFPTMSPASGASSHVPAVPTSVGGSCSTRAMTPAFGYGKRPSFKQRVLMITPRRELSTTAMEEVVQISSTILSPTPSHVPAPFEADALDIRGSPLTVDAPSSGGSNSFDCFQEQLDTQLLPTWHEPPTKKRKIPKRRYVLTPTCRAMCDIFCFLSFVLPGVFSLTL